MDEDFCLSVNHREQIVSTLLGEGIALPHSLVLQARQSVVYTVLAPDGIPWGEERAYVIFYWLSARLNIRQRWEFMIFLWN